MLTASLVLYHNSKHDVDTIISCVLNSFINRLYIIDNSRNDAFRILEKRSEKIRYIHNENNGYGAAHNIAIKKSIEQGAKYHVILNPDIIFQAGSIESLTKFMDFHPEVGSVMPNIVYPNGRSQRLCKLLPTPFDIFARRFFPKSWMKKRNAKYEMHFMGYDKIWNCPNLSGCFMFLRIDILKQIGGFDDRFFMYFEDTDLIRRIHTVSKTVFYPDVTIIHAHKAEHRTNKFLLKASIKSAIKYFNKYGWFFDRERKLFNSLAKRNISLIRDSY